LPELESKCLPLLCASELDNTSQGLPRLSRMPSPDAESSPTPSQHPGRSLNVPLKQALCSSGLTPAFNNANPAETFIDSTRISPELVNKQMTAMSNTGLCDVEGNAMVAPGLFGPGVECTPDLERKARTLRFWVRAHVSKYRQRRQRESGGHQASVKPRQIQCVDKISGDGLLPEAFRLLWSKDGTGKGSTSIQLPDTVIFQGSAIEAHYFTSKDGSVMRRNSENLTVRKIYKALMAKAAPGSDIVASVYRCVDQASPAKSVSPRNDSHSWTLEECRLLVAACSEGSLNFVTVAQQMPDPSPSARQCAQMWQKILLEAAEGHKSVADAVSDASYPREIVLDRIVAQEDCRPVQNVQIEYLDEAGLRKILFAAPISENISCTTVLQQFVPSYHSDIRQTSFWAVWTPNLLRVERYTAEAVFEDRKAEIVSRCATVDCRVGTGTRRLVSSGALYNCIRDACHEFVRHVAVSSGLNVIVTRASLHFVVDSNRELKLLYCSGLRHTGAEEKSVIRNVLSKPNRSQGLQLHGSSAFCRDKNEQTVQCPGCDKSVSWNQMTEQLYTTVMQWHSSTQHPERIPHLLSKAQPELTESLYQKFKGTSEFMTCTILLCEECFLSYSNKSEQRQIKNQRKLAVAASLPNTKELAEVQEAMACIQSARVPSKPVPKAGKKQRSRPVSAPAVRAKPNQKAVKAKTRPPSAGPSRGMSRSDKLMSKWGVSRGLESEPRYTPLSDDFTVSIEANLDMLSEDESPEGEQEDKPEWNHISDNIPQTLELGDVHEQKHVLQQAMAAGRARIEAGPKLKPSTLPAVPKLDMGRLGVKSSSRNPKVRSKVSASGVKVAGRSSVCVSVDENVAMAVPKVIAETGNVFSRHSKAGDPCPPARWNSFFDVSDQNEGVKQAPVDSIAKPRAIYTQANDELARRVPRPCVRPEAVPAKVLRKKATKKKKQMREKEPNTIAAQLPKPYIPPSKQSAELNIFSDDSDDINEVIQDDEEFIRF